MTEPETIAVEPFTSEAAQRLVAALNAELVARYPDPLDLHFSLTEEQVAPGQGAFLVARAGARPIGCGAVRRLDAGTAEIKRMYVAPEARGRGLAGRILARLEVEARRLHAVRLVLEMGDRQPEAGALYARAGFTPIPRYGEYACAPHSICLGKMLG
jgi:putative acetyltransferase